MIVKMHNRGTGAGSGPVEYLLGRDGQREGSRVLFGDPETTIALIDNSDYAKKYTSGVLSFGESDLDEAAKREIMQDFEASLMPGISGEQYSILWVEHRDKGRLELNFVIPNTELSTGKRLQPYFHGADARRMGYWQDAQNAERGLSDPNDPARKRTLSTPRDLPPDRQKAAEAITAGLTARIAAGDIADRKGVVEALEAAGYGIARQGKDSISLKMPEGSKNLKLRGAIYEQSFGVGRDLRETIEAASRQYERERGSRAEAARAELAIGIEIKRVELEKRYQRPLGRGSDRVAIELEGQRNGVAVGADRGRGGALSTGMADRAPDHATARTAANDRAIGGQNGRGDHSHMDGGVLSSVAEAPKIGGGDARIGRNSNQIIEITDHDSERESLVKRTIDHARRARDWLKELTGNVRAYLVGQSGRDSANERISRAGGAFGAFASAVDRQVLAVKTKQEEIAKNRQIAQDARGRGYSR
jgi:hypothetical protein